MIYPSFLDEGIMGALFCNDPILQDHDATCLADQRGLVGNQEHRSASEYFGKVLPQHIAACAIQRATEGVISVSPRAGVSTARTV